MAAQIIILSDNFKTTTNGWMVRYLFWFNVPVAQRVPVANKNSEYLNASAGDLSALRSGAVIEEIYEDFFPLKDDIDGVRGVKAELVVKYNNRLAEISARGNNPMRYHGRQYDGVTWT